MHPDAEKLLQELMRQRARVTKLELDKTVLVEALEEIISNDWCTYATRTIVLKAMEAVKESK